MKTILVVIAFSLLSIGSISFTFASPPCYPGEDCAPKINIKSDFFQGEIYNISVSGRFGLTGSSNSNIVTFNNREYVALGGSFTTAGVYGNLILISLPLYRLLLSLVLISTILFVVYLVRKKSFKRD